jgi:hypothetical protein
MLTRLCPSTELRQHLAAEVAHRLAFVAFLCFDFASFASFAVTCNRPVATGVARHRKGRKVKAKERSNDEVMSECTS